MMRRRSASVAIAVTLQQLAEGKSSGWTDDQETGPAGAPKVERHP